MKPKLINKLLLLIPALVMVCIAGCKKKDFMLPDGALTTKDYVYNVALKGFQPEDKVNGNITANISMKVIYYYLQRESKQDTLIQLDFVPTEQQTNYTFAVNASIWAGINLQGVKGLKLLCVQDNNTSLEKVIKISYYDPAAPVLTGIPETLTPVLIGNTAISGKATSETGIQKIYFYDNRSGSFKAIDSISGNGSKDLTINYNYVYADGAGQLKVAAVDIYGLRVEKTIQFVNIPFKPVITFATDTLRAALPDGKPAVTGTLKTYAAVTTVNVFVKTAGGETLSGSVTPVLTGSGANEYNYTFSYPSFAYADDVTYCKLVVTDGGGSNNAGEVPVKILPYYHWKNVTMMAQGITGVNSTSCFFTGDPAQPLLGPCEVIANSSLDAKIDFAIFCNSSLALSFNNPANISASTISTFKCSGTSWNPATPTANTLKKTLFRVLASSVAETRVYTAYNGGTITDLGDAFFTGVSAASANAPNSTQFTTASLIWGKMTPASGGTTKNILIKINAVNIVPLSSQGTSTVTIDIMKEK
ncbi:MAG: hypothetical protein QM731_24725 [Chitinophagaceae bacterium]